MQQRKRKNRNKLSNKFRIAIFNDTTHEKLFAFRANGTWSLVTIALVVVFLIVSVTMLISFTSLREFIPGYPSAESRRTLIQNQIKIDSLQREVDLWRLQLVNVQRIATGKEPLQIDSLMHIANGGEKEKIDRPFLAQNDSLLRKTVMEEEKFKLSSAPKKISQIEGLHFFPPVKGIVTQEYSTAIRHPYTDIAAEPSSVVSSVLAGTVIAAEWNDDDGYVMEIQHDHNLISIYKHNAKLLKKKGDKVSAGTPIALVGNTGKNTTGSHLHFELWHSGEPVNPQTYIKF
jgi:murein DD-endopeptidase MepM/ murein hydrolase activator NlpD